MLTDEELKERRNRIGASDVAAIMGIPTFQGRNAYTTWLDKCDMLEPPKKVSAAIKAGNRLEPVLLDYAEDIYGPLDRNVVVWDPDGSPIASTLDGQVVSDGVPVEVKTSGIEGPIHGAWGEAGSDEVPDNYIMQCMTQILCTGADKCHVVALLGSRGFAEYKIDPQDDLIKLIREVCSDFFSRYIATKIDPREEWGDRLSNIHGVTLTSDPCEPNYAIMKLYRKVPNKTIKLSDVDMILSWQAARQARIDAEKLEKLEQAKVLAALGDAEEATLLGGMALTHFSQHGAPIINRDQMKIDGVYDKYTTENNYRVLRLKKGKK